MRNVQGGNKPAGNSNLFDIDFACLPRQLQLRLKVSVILVFDIGHNLVLCFLHYLDTAT